MKTAREYMGNIIGSASGGFPHDQATKVIAEAMEQEYKRGYEEGLKEGEKQVFIELRKYANKLKGK